MSAMSDLAIRRAEEAFAFHLEGHTELEAMGSVLEATAQAASLVNPCNNTWIRGNGDFAPLALNPLNPHFGRPTWPGVASEGINGDATVCPIVPTTGQDVLPVTPNPIRPTPLTGSTTKDEPVGSAMVTSRARPAPRKGTGSHSYGDCRHCGRSLILRNGRLPAHHPPDDAGEVLKQVCQGTNEAPAEFIEGA